MDLDRATTLMADNAQRIRALVHVLSDLQARWRPDQESWSVLEVIMHLLDEERLDFSVRVDYTLHRPGEPWPAIDPAGRVTEAKYNEQDWPATLDTFLAERQASIAWLRGLSAPNWQSEYQAPWGAISAGDALASWVAHDLLHMRQLVELLWACTTEELKPQSVDYAGQW
jgi:hypothetical protein